LDSPKTETPTAPTKQNQPCGFCSTNNHHLCIVAVRNGDGTPYPCGCALEMIRRNHPIARCVDCGNRRAEEVGLNYMCTDPAACQNDRDTRAAATLREMFQVEPGAELSPTMQASIKITTKETSVTKPAKLGVGSCLCCEVPTRGGSFAPGHDTRFVSILVHDVLTGAADREVVRAQLDLMPKLQDKFDKRLELNAEVPEAKRAEFITKWKELAEARRAKRAEANPTGRPSNHNASGSVAFQEVGE
jgi:hypothetical protein